MAWARLAALLALATVIPLLAMAALAEEPVENESEGGSGHDRGIEFGSARIFGYGDLHYNSPRGSDFPDRRQSDLADVHRFVIGVSYNWTDRLSLHAEIDFEHAANGSDLEFELGHIDYRHSDALGFRAGAVLMPVGSLNESHEPTTYYSVERPQIDNFIIPSTWQELGAGIFGTISSPVPIRYRTYVVSNLNAAGFSADQGIRGGRGKLKSQNTSGAAWVGRVEIEPFLGLTIGASGYYGSASVFGTANGVTNAARLTSVGVNLWTAEAKYIKGPFEIQGRYAVLNVGDAVAVSNNNGTNNDPVAERSTGWLGEAAVHTAQWLFPESDLDLVLFGRYQEIDTQERVPAGTTKNLAFDRNILTWGLAFYPHRDVALKADVEHWEISTGQSDERYNLGLAFVY